MKNEATNLKTNDRLEPTVLVFFGGAGDLTWRKRVPALFDLSQDRSLPTQFAIVAVGTCGSENTQGLLAPQHRWPLPTELVASGKKKGKNS